MIETTSRADPWRQFYYRVDIHRIRDSLFGNPYIRWRGLNTIDFGGWVLEVVDD